MHGIMHVSCPEKAKHKISQTPQVCLAARDGAAGSGGAPLFACKLLRSCCLTLQFIPACVLLDNLHVVGIFY